MKKDSRWPGRIILFGPLLLMAIPFAAISSGAADRSLLPVYSTMLAAGSLAMLLGWPAYYLGIYRKRPDVVERRARRRQGQKTPQIRRTAILSSDSRTLISSSISRSLVGSLFGLPSALFGAMNGKKKHTVTFRILWEDGHESLETVDITSGRFRELTNYLDN